MTTLPILPASYGLGDRTTILESQQIEYKRSTSSRKKLIQTLCGFLNTNGGYMLFGIEDDLYVTGIIQKHVDQIARSVDDIIRDNSIINTTTGEPLHHRELTTITIPITDEPCRVVMAIRALSLHPGSIYSLVSGERVYRLNASNHVIRGPPTEFERLNRRVCDLMTEIAKVKKFNSILTERLHSSDIVLGELYDRILADKAAAEKRLTGGYCGWLTGLLAF